MRKTRNKPSGKLSNDSCSVPLYHIQTVTRQQKYDQKPPDYQSLDPLHLPGVGCGFLFV